MRCVLANWEDSARKDREGARPRSLPATTLSRLWAACVSNTRGQQLAVLLLVDLDVAASDGTSIAVREIHRSGYADEKRVLARARLSIITGVHRVLVAQFLIHLGIAFEGRAVTGESYRRHAGVRAVHIDAPARSAIVVIGKRNIGLVVVGNESEVGGLSGRLGSDLAATGDLHGSWRWRWRLVGATPGRDDARTRSLLVREVRLPRAERLRVVGGTMHGRLRGTLRTGDVVIREGDVGAVQRIERHLEKVSQVAVGVAAQPSGRDRPQVDDVIAGGILRKRGHRVTSHGLRGVNIPLCPAVVCAYVRTRAGRRHHASVV